MGEEQPNTELSCEAPRAGFVSFISLFYGPCKDMDAWVVGFPASCIPSLLDSRMHQAPHDEHNDERGDKES
jgi:hypothetical protein